jgi:hypothetical protein
LRCVGSARGAFLNGGVVVITSKARKKSVELGVVEDATTGPTGVSCRARAVATNEVPTPRDVIAEVAGFEVAVDGAAADGGGTLGEGGELCGF